MRTKHNKKSTKVLFRISNKIEKKYLESLKELSIKLYRENNNETILFEVSTYDFIDSEKKQLKYDPDSFLTTKYIDQKFITTYNSIIYIPNSDINLKGNYIWYAIGRPDHQVMILSSFIFKNLIEDSLSFGPYLFLAYSQFIARYTTNFDKPHEVSRNCLNDHCADQAEILNVFNNLHPFR